MQNSQKQKGVTLLEILLVLAIASSLLLLGVRQYTQYKRDQYPDDLKLKISQLFQAAANYYKANCESGSLSSASLGVSDLKDFLPAQWSSVNPLVSPDQYVIQFNESTVDVRFIYACYNGACSDPEPISSTTKNNTSYQLQVAVKLADSSMASMLSYKALLGADCISDLNGKQVTPCGATTAGTGPYLVWTRSPSLAMFNSNSNLWPSVHTVNQFKLQYTHDPMYEMANPTATSPLDSRDVYYQCGG